MNIRCYQRPSNPVCPSISIPFNTSEHLNPPTMADEYDPFASMASFTKVWHNKPSPPISMDRPELSVQDKVVFITGGGSGIGKATAIAFAQAGARAIAIFGRRRFRLESAAQEIRSASKSATTIVIFEDVDLSKSSAVDAAFLGATQQIGLGKVDIYISNAGIATTRTSVAKYTEEDFDEGVDLNFRAPYNAFKAILPYLVVDAKVLNISSGIGHMAPIPSVHWMYASTKAATIKMFDYIQAEHPDLHVVNVQPGIVASEINGDLDIVRIQDEGELTVVIQYQYSLSYS